MSKSGRSEKANISVQLNEDGGSDRGPPGLDGFGDVGEARLNFNRMVGGMAGLQEISESVETD